MSLIKNTMNEFQKNKGRYYKEKNRNYTFNKEKLFFLFSKILLTPSRNVSSKRNRHSKRLQLKFSNKSIAAHAVPPVAKTSSISNILSSFSIASL